VNLEIGVAQRALPGQIVSGDVWKVFEGRDTTIVVADGLGHGPAAEEAARLFCDFAEERLELPVDEILRRAAKQFVHPRGTAATLLRFDTSSERLHFSGVGNVTLQAASSHPVSPVCMPGILGRPVRKITAFDYPLERGDLFALYSDGISSRFDLRAFRNLKPPIAADQILDEHGKVHDDATCVVIRCV